MGDALAAVLAGNPVPGASPLAPRERPAIAKVSYTHEAMINLIIASGGTISQNDLAEHFGYSASWISTVISSDAFQAKLAERSKELIDPEVLQSFETQIKGLLARSLEILRHKLAKKPDDVPDQLALQTAKVATAALGMGDKGPQMTVHETHVHLEEHGAKLVGLLRRSRVVAEQGPQGSSPAGETSPRILENSHGV